MKTCSTARSSLWGENAATPCRAFLSFPDKNRICPHQHCMGSFRGLAVGKVGHRTALCALFRPIVTDILCENLPAYAATSRFIAYQTRLFYHNSQKKARHFVCDKSRTLRLHLSFCIQFEQNMPFRHHFRHKGASSKEKISFL